MRFGCYRADPDLQHLHQMAPMIALWDDHESANDSWEGGAQNHQAATEGDWNLRRAAAMQVYRQWTPVSDEPWQAYPISTLATLHRTCWVAPAGQYRRRLQGRRIQRRAEGVPRRGLAGSLSDTAWPEPGKLAGPCAQHRCALTAGSNLKFRRQTLS